MATFDEIQGIIGKRLSVDPQKVTRDAHLHFDLGADSLSVINLSADFSQKYQIDIQGEDILESENVGELVRLIESKILTRPSLTQI